MANIVIICVPPQSEWIARVDCFQLSELGKCYRLLLGDMPDNHLPPSYHSDLH